MIIKNITPTDDFTLLIEANDGRQGKFDISPYFKYEVFAELKDLNKFKDILNGGYYIEWDCGADLSADTIETHLEVLS